MNSTKHNPYLLILITACSGMFLSTLDAGVINVALPFLRQDFHTTVNHISWTISSYMLVLSATLVLFGKLADRFNRLDIFSIGLLLFALGSLLCGLATSANQLIVWRVIQAFGAAAMQGTAASIITTLIDPEKKNRAMGILGSTLALGSVIGPAFAGIMISVANWRWIFFINIPLCLLALITTRLLNNPLKPQKTALDYPGMALFAITVFSFVLALTLSNQLSGKKLIVISLAIIAIIGLLLFIYQERRSATPMLNLQLFKTLAFSVSLLGISAFGFAAGSLYMLPPLDMHLIAHLTPWQIGLVSLAAPLGMAMTSRFSGIAIDYWGEKRLMLCGLTILLAALILLALRHPSWGVLSFVILLFIYGLGCGVFVPPNISHIMQSAGAEHQGTMGAINRMFFNLGNGVGVVTAAFIITINTEQTTAKIFAGLRWAWCAAAIVMAIALISAIYEQLAQKHNI